ncbi:hypothetical protein D3C87_1667940 [compost metagenome]
MNLRVVGKKTQQVQPFAGHRPVDKHQVQRLATVLHQWQELVEALHRCYAKVAELIEQSLDPQAVEVLRIGDQDAQGFVRHGDLQKDVDFKRSQSLRKTFLGLCRNFPK